MEPNDSITKTGLSAEVKVLFDVSELSMNLSFVLDLQGNDQQVCLDVEVFSPQSDFAGYCSSLSFIWEIADFRAPICLFVVSVSSIFLLFMSTLFTSHELKHTSHKKVKPEFWQVIFLKDCTNEALEMFLLVEQITAWIFEWQKLHSIKLFNGTFTEQEPLILLSSSFFAGNAVMVFLFKQMCLN